MAFAGVSNIKGLGLLETLDLSSIFSGLGSLLLILFMGGMIAGILFAILWRTKNKNLYNQKIYFFEEINGEFIPIEDCMARELTIPNTDVRVFYIKSKDMYMPRGVKKMGKSAYWYAIRNNREIINFRIKNMNREMEDAGLDFDHTDMRYAYDNLKEIIKRNYKDKNVKWWEVYSTLINLVVYVFVFTMAFYFLISKIGGLLSSIDIIADKVGGYIGQASNLNTASGIKPA